METSSAAPQPLSSREESVIALYLDAIWMEKGLSQNSLDSYRTDLSLFAHWLCQQGKNLLSATSGDLQAYLAYRLEQKFQSRSSARFLSCMRGFYRHQLREGVLQENPMALI